MSKIVKTTNIKPNSWYEEYLKLENDYTKEFDIMANKNQSHSYSGFLQFEEKNNLETNKKLLEKYKNDLESLKLWKSIKDIDIIDGSEEWCIIQTSFKIDKCFEALEQRYLITGQLEDIKIETEDYWYNEECAKSIVDILKQFKFRNYQKELSDFIKQNVNWRDKKRDFEIYQEIREGTLYSEIAEKLECTIPAISMINKKVQTSINNLKGRFFEIEYEKYLRSLDKFRNCRIVRDGKPGKPDIYIIDKINNRLYVFSLKNLELNKKSFSIIKEKLKPEIRFAYYNSSFKDKEVSLYLIVFDSLTEKIHIKELDYNNPSNINIHR